MEHTAGYVGGLEVATNREVSLGGGSRQTRNATRFCLLLVVVQIAAKLSVYLTFYFREEK